MVFLRLWWPGLSLNHFGLTIVLWDVERYTVVAMIDTVNATLFLTGLAVLLYSVNQKFQRELRLVGYALCTGSAVFYAVVHTADDLMYWKSFIILEPGAVAVNAPFIGAFATAAVSSRLLSKELRKRVIGRVGTQLAFVERTGRGPSTTHSLSCLSAAKEVSRSVFLTPTARPLSSSPLFRAAST